MAKKKQLTIEEKLQNALVPKDEQPYKIPNNWCWSYWKYIAEIFSAKRIHKSDWKEEGIPFYRAREIVKLSQDGYVNNEIFISNEKYLEIKRISRLPKSGDLMVSGVGTIGASYVVKENDKFYYKDASVLCVSGYNKINAKYLNFYLKSPYMIKEMKKGSKGTTVDTLTINKFNNYLIVLPPISEQQRIVERIESLFAKLDRAKELIENTLAQWEQNKMAILHKAFIGELTAKWRKENKIDLSSWKKCELKEVFKVVKDKYNPQTENQIVNYIGLENIETSKGIISKNNSSEVKSIKTKFKKDDVLYGKLRPYLNKHDVVNFDGICSTDILVFRFNNINTAKYINYYFNLPMFIQYAVENSSGINLPRVSEKTISKYKISLPTIEEQQEIVNILDKLLAKYNKIKNLEQQLEKIELLKKAILAKAFRGELGTNNPDEESAEKLLTEILAEKEN